MDILLVEDHDDTRAGLEAMLSRRGYRVATVKNLRGALALIRGTPFDVIVSDIALADGTGYELMAEARRAGVRALGIAISGYPYPEDVHEPKVTGFDYHLSKPLEVDRLHRLLEQLETKKEAPETAVVDEATEFRAEKARG